MGLDGISINQLRVTPDLNSAELNAVNLNPANEVKAVDSLSNGQRVDPDKENEHANQGNLSGGAQDSENDDNELDEEIIKYDLSDSNKYLLKLDDVQNAILIIEKKTNKIIQTIDADELSKLVLFSKSSCGAIVNRKF